MTFYEISDAKGLVGLILHDYSTGYFSVHTNKRSFQLCIDASVRFFKSGHLIKSGDHTLKVGSFSPNHVAWVSTILGRVLGGPSTWHISNQGDLKAIDSIDEFVSSKLSY